jgi:plastocyanin
MHGMRRIVIAMATLTLLLAACGKSSSKTTASSSSGGPPVGLTGQVNNKGDKDLTGKTSGALEVNSFYFEPTFVKATPSTTLQLELSNVSKTTHTFTIDALQINEELPAGAKHTVAVTVPATGALRWYCRFHAGQGMQGSVYTKAGDPITNTPPTTGAGIRY